MSDWNMFETINALREAVMSHEARIAELEKMAGIERETATKNKKQ